MALESYVYDHSLEHLLELHPEAIREKGSRGILPLHLAAESKHLDDRYTLLALLIREYPGALRLMGNMGRFPLHLVCLCHDFFW